MGDIGETEESEPIYIIPEVPEPIAVPEPDRELEPA